MRKPEGLAKAAAMIAVVAALATMLLVNVEPPAAPHARNTRAARVQGIPVPPAHP